MKDFMGFNTIFLLSDSEIPRGQVIATPVENIVLYYVDPNESDFARAGLVYTVSGETNLIGFHTQGNYHTAVSEERTHTQGIDAGQQPSFSRSVAE
jgi:hypothetical protein